MDNYRRDILLKYVVGLNRLANTILGLGILAAIICVAGGLFDNPEQNAVMGIVSGFGFLLGAVATSFGIKVVAQLVRCFVRMEEHLESLSTDANLRMANMPVGHNKQAA